MKAAVFSWDEDTRLAAKYALYVMLLSLQPDVPMKNGVRSAGGAQFTFPAWDVPMWTTISLVD